MKKSVKSMLTFALALTLTVSCLGGTAFAASESKRSTTIDGCPATAEVKTSSESGVAITRITGATGAYAYAMATVYYKFGADNYYTEDADEMTTGYAVAVAEVQMIPGKVVGATGQHTIYYNNITWSPAMTKTGETLNSAIKV